jgi:hypothetical protein
MPSNTGQSASPTGPRLKRRICRQGRAATRQGRHQAQVQAASSRRHPRCRCSAVGCAWPLLFQLPAFLPFFRDCASAAANRTSSVHAKRSKATQPPAAAVQSTLLSTLNSAAHLHHKLLLVFRGHAGQEVHIVCRKAAGQQRQGIRRDGQSEGAWCTSLRRHRSVLEGAGRRRAAAAGQPASPARDCSARHTRHASQGL